MMRNENLCSDCDHTRRDFLKLAGGLAVAGALPSLGAASEATSAETKVKELYHALSKDQKKVLCFKASDPLRNRVQANWAITEPTIDELEPKQQDMVEQIVRGLSSEEGFEKFMKQMADDAGGLGSYHIAIFGDPDSADFEFVLTGRHCTMRADGQKEDGVGFGGPMVYGHAPSSFNEEPAHPNNAFWYQAKRANDVFAALDGEQRKQALQMRAPKESDIKHRKKHPGIAVSDLSADQKELVSKVMSDLLSPYRKQDVDEVMQIITANGGLDKIHLAFYQQAANGSSGDIGNDKVWDIWRLQGPGFVWHFRGKPHVHTWVNIARV